ncbi:ribonuclease III [Gigaspora margarita]|uniref:Large ribosomal subunit protein mL44 n=1 Tax=Gigaspora margarita TaxID=4874 RepID=A0A8H4AYU1_GIGMA|nr:ribonuclease III [Gigaspora margarita]
MNLITRRRILFTNNLLITKHFSRKNSSLSTKDAEDTIDTINTEDTKDTKNTKEKIPSTLYSLSARLNLNFANQNLLLQAVTHKNFHENDLLTNEGLQVLGNHALGLYVTEYLHLKYPLLPLPCIQQAITAYCGHLTLTVIGQEVGLQYVVRWNNFTDEELFLQGKEIPKKNKSVGKSREPVQRITQGTAISHALKAIVGALYIDKGPQSARQFIHDHILSRDVNMQDVIEIREPKRELSALMKRLKRPSPISRLKSETGRLSYAPAFVVGVYSGTEQLGEGFGSSVKMAEFRAGKNALLQYYLKEARDFTLPSIIDSHEKQATYIPTKVGDTPPRL